MKIYTIGFTKKTAREFFDLLRKNSINKILDVRLNNSSQLAGYSKGTDLEFFCELCGIRYQHDLNLAPTKEILDNYKSKTINWTEYEMEFNKLLEKRQKAEEIDLTPGIVDGVCLLCSEDKAKNCHRRLIAEYIKNQYPEKEIEIIHI